MKINLEEQKEGLIIDYLSLTLKAPPSYLSCFIDTHASQSAWLPSLELNNGVRLGWLSHNLRKK